LNISEVELDGAGAIIENEKHFLTEGRKRAFEHGVNSIALKVSSPMGKVFSYSAWLNRLMPLTEMEADVA
jgi:hypothetical protein